MKYLKTYENYNHEYIKILYSDNDKKIILLDNNKIKKEYKNSNDYNLILAEKYFILDEKIFPKVYDTGINYIIVECLDTKKAKNEFKKLNDYFKKNFKSTVRPYIYMDSTNEDAKKSTQPKKLESSLPIDIEELFLKYKNLMDKIKKIIKNKSFLLDVHEDNFGYDINGNLKMIDL